MKVAKWNPSAQSIAVDARTRSMTVSSIPPTPADGTSARITDDEAEALARTTVNLFAKWGLNDSEARILLGDMPTSTWANWKRGQFGDIPHDRRSRMALLMGIHKGLRYLFREPERGYAWICKPNSAFGGASALDVMMRGETVELVQVRDYLAAERGL